LKQNQGFAEHFPEKSASTLIISIKIAQILLVFYEYSSYLLMHEKRPIPSCAQMWDVVRKRKSLLGAAIVHPHRAGFPRLGHNHREWSVQVVEMHNPIAEPRRRAASLAKLSKTKTRIPFARALAHAKVEMKKLRKQTLKETCNDTIQSEADDTRLLVGAL
jgi:hypothetical protein